jgi:RHS repeat-associated protein
LNAGKYFFEYNTFQNRSDAFYGNDLETNRYNQPYRKHYSADGSTEIKYNVATSQVEFLFYIDGDGYSAPLVCKSDGTTQEYLYLQRDYQGSIVGISNAAGQVLERRTFDAWGVMRVTNANANYLSIDGSTTLLDRGYTGHEHLHTLRLINMNARIYDPTLRRFLSPDNYVQDPTNSQNFNRYAYCWNNPLKYTDPSGNFTWSDLIAIVSIVAGTALTIWGGPAGVAWGWKLIGAGVAHFGTAFSIYNNNKAAGWDAASNYVGFSSPQVNINFGDGGGNKDKKNGINEGDDYQEISPKGKPTKISKETIPCVICHNEIKGTPFGDGDSTGGNWFSDRQSGYIFDDGMLTSDFTGDKVGKNGVLYGVTQNPWSPGAEVHNFNPSPLLKDINTLSNMLSTKLELAGTLRDIKNTTSVETKRDSVSEWYMVRMRDGIQRGANNKMQRDSLMDNGGTSWYLPYKKGK